MRYLLIIFLFLSSCTSITFVRKQSVPTKEATVRYSLPGSPDKDRSYREKFEKEARAYCGGDFTITREYEALENGGTSSGIGVGTGGVALGFGVENSSKYQYIDFACSSSSSNR